MGSKIFLPEKMAILMLLLVAKVDGYIGFRKKDPFDRLCIADIAAIYLAPLLIFI
jgi:hypothetical protein